MNKIYTLIISFSLLSFSCASKSNSDHVLPAFEGDNVLVIPPLAKDKKMADAIGRSMTAYLAGNVSSKVRYAGDIPKLKDTLSNRNLMSDGQVNMQEISKIGAAVNAREVICVRVTTYTPYPPQTLSCVIIARTLQGQKYKQRVAYLNLNMRDIEHKKEFADFVGGSLRGPLGDRFIKKTNVNAEAAMLSNAEFNNFAGYKISNNILYMKKY